MTASQGRSRLGLVLAASTFGIVLGLAQPALACHIPHDHSSTTTKAPATPSATASPATPPTALDLIKPLSEQAKPEPQVIAPAPSTAPASHIMMPGGSPNLPTVQNWHGLAPAACTPPTPPCVARVPATLAQAQEISPLKAPASYLNPPVPTPAPEPSTILSALALAGAFAWRRRATQARG